MDYSNQANTSQQTAEPIMEQNLRPPEPTGLGSLRNCEAETQVQVPTVPNRPRRVEIEAKDFGFLVTVGCQQFAIESKRKLISKLEDYLNNPELEEKKWFDKKEL